VLQRCLALRLCRAQTTASTSRLKLLAHMGRVSWSAGATLLNQFRIRCMAGLGGCAGVLWVWQVHVRQLAHLLPRGALPPGVPASAAPVVCVNQLKLQQWGCSHSCQCFALLSQGVEDVNLRRYLRWANTGELKDPTKQAPAAGAPQIDEQAVRQQLMFFMLPDRHFCCLRSCSCRLLKIWAKTDDVAPVFNSCHCSEEPGRQTAAGWNTPQRCKAESNAAASTIQQQAQGCAGGMTTAFSTAESPLLAAA
jgi:hypothetical protein